VFLLAFSLTAFGLTVLAQALIWRARQPSRHTGLMLKVFGLGYLGALGALGCLLAAHPGLAPLTAGWSLCLFSLFYGPMGFMYISFHTLLQFDSPSLTIMNMGAAAGSAGCAEAELVEALGRRDMVAERLAAAQAGGLSETVDGLIRLTPSGRLWARIFDLLARVFNLQRAG
jgi:hypothetical protein